MARLSDRFLQLGVVFALCGMGLGVWMGATENIILAPVHAHINLLGWVSMLLYGLFYRAVPEATAGRLPVLHFWISLLGLLGLIPLLGLYLMGNRSITAALGLDSVALLVSMVIFAIIVFKATWSARPS